MAATTLARLQSIFPALTAAEQRVAATIIERPLEMRELSGRELARLSGISESAVFRLAHKLGFAGFKELKLALLEEHVAGRTRGELGIFNIPIHYNAPVAVQAQEVLQAYVDSLQRTAALVEAERIREVAQLLRDASLVTLVGMGSSLAAASLAENVLLRCGIICRLTSDSHVQLLQTLQTVGQHVVVAFSYSGETSETVDALQVASLHGAHTVAVTAFAQSSLTRYAGVVLMVPVVNLPLYRVGLVDAVLPYLMLLDLLAIQITAPDAPRAAALRDEVEQIMRRRKLRDAGKPSTGTTAALSVARGGHEGHEGHEERSDA